MNSGRSRSAIVGPDLLEPRRMMSIHFAIDATASVHAISRYIYGVDQSLAGAYANGTSTRAGGNRWTAYNWETNASNAGSDYQYQNDNYLSSSSAPGAAVAPTISNAESHNAAAIVTIPMAGYVSGDKGPGGDVRKNSDGTPNTNYLTTRFKLMKPRKGSAFSLTPNTTDDSVYADEFVNWLKQTYPAATNNPNEPIFFDLDNEPDLWSSTHAEIHPSPTTYSELINDSIDYAGAIKDVMPGAEVFGPVSYGWNGYTTLQNAPDANNRDFLDTYLTQLKAASTTAGRRLVDALDLHWYPEATGGGVRITGPDTTAAVVAARLQAPRSLWDPTYTETSWITQYSTKGPINLIPRMKAKIAADNPGTQLAITEYNYGGNNDISGGIAEADVLGIFGRESVFAANEWPLNGAETFTGGAFQMFRNYDGARATFGDTSISATTDDVADSSVYASLDSTNKNFMTIVAINKTANALPAAISLAHVGVADGANANVYCLTAANAMPQAAGTVAIAGNAINYSMPAYSVTTIRVPILSAPKATTQAFNYQTAPNTVSIAFDQDVSGSLSASDLIVTPAAGGSAIAPTSVSFDSSTDTATFALPTPLPDGDYHATLDAPAVTNAGGVPLSSSAEVDFFSLAGDVNHDRSVDFNDLVIVAQNYGTSGHTFGEGNLDNSSDGLVDFNDLVILAQHYGGTLPPPNLTASIISSIPTPTGGAHHRDTIEINPVTRVK